MRRIALTGLFFLSILVGMLIPWLVGCGTESCEPRGLLVDAHDQWIWDELESCYGVGPFVPVRVSVWPASEPCKNPGNLSECHNGQRRGIKFRGFYLWCNDTAYVVEGNSDRDAIVRHEMQHGLRKRLGLSRDPDHEEAWWARC